MNTREIVYVAAKIDTSDNFLGFGCEWIYYDDKHRFKIARCPKENAGWFRSRLGSGLMLFGYRGLSTTLAEAITDACEMARYAH